MHKINLKETSSEDVVDAVDVVDVDIVKMKFGSKEPHRMSHQPREYPRAVLRFDHVISPDNRRQITKRFWMSWQERETKNAKTAKKITATTEIELKKLRMRSTRCTAWKSLEE